LEKSVLIPVPLVKQIIELLGYWDVSNYDRVICDERSAILCALDVKLRKLELRDAYAKIIAADSDDQRHDARMEYLWHKARINEMSVDDRSF
jgi:hypothetical protein